MSAYVKAGFMGILSYCHGHPTYSGSGNHVPGEDLE
jgi:hypothetical protein